MIILGAINSDKYDKKNLKSAHMKDRLGRESLSVGTKLVYCFRVYIDNSIQIHCLYNDASLYVHNEKSKHIVTVILLKRKRLHDYLKEVDRDNGEYNVLIKCAKIHEKLKTLDPEEVKARKLELIKINE